MPTYENQRTSALAAVVGLIAPNGVGAINGQVHQDNEVNQVNDYYNNLVAYDGFTYRFVRVDNNNANNAVSLQAAYDEAKLLTPGGSALSATNRVAILLPPGTYSFGTGVFAVDTQFIDFVGLGPNAADVILYSAHIDPDGQGTVTKSVDDVTFMNLTIHNDGVTLVNQDSMDASAYAPQVTAVSEVFKNVRITVGDPTQAWPTRLEVNYAGTYTDVYCQPDSQQSFADCPGTFNNVSTGDYAFFVASGVFNSCTAGIYGYGSIAGSMTNCRGGAGSFAAIQSTARIVGCYSSGSAFGYTANGAYLENCGAAGSAFVTGGSLLGTHVNCYGGNGSFSAAVLGGTFTGCRCSGSGFGITANAILSGTFTDCISGNNSFGLGAASDLSGTFRRCYGAGGSFGAGLGSTLSGAFDGCSGLANCFGQQSSTLSGTFTNCTATSASFGYGATSATISTISGTLRNCHGTDDCFGRNTSITSTALLEYCSGRDRCFGQGSNGLSGQGVSGTLRYCTGRDACFGAGMTATIKTAGIFEHCIARNGSFGAGAGMEASGIFRHCIGGDGCFGYASSPGVGEAPVASGLFESCFGADYCFGSSLASVSGTEASGVFKGCRAGLNSFGSTYIGGGGAEASGTFIDCDGGWGSFGMQEAGTGAMTGSMVNCRWMTDGLIEVTNNKGTVLGRMENCQIKVTEVNASALLVDDGAKIMGCTLIGNGTGYSVVGLGSPTLASVSHCRGLANGIDAGTVTNQIGTPYNVFDNDI